ncbi:T9SS type A sorting domain-containing protein, partial [candidate division KSB1 bacterium]|nr:T9SS type A sorting domain-containing protein [candidate division KSB1 bacterium]
SILQNYPNPFNPNTTITLSIPDAGAVDLKIYDIRGRLVKQLLNQVLPAGRHAIEWNGRNEQGQQVASGIYLGVMRFDQKREVIKMQLIR